jgi:putative hydrolase of the HAD superfamily
MNWTVGFDADDTLWHCENHFEQAQQRFIELLAPYQAEQLPMARLADIEKENMRLYGYGVKGFMLSMIETAVDITEGRVSGQDVKNIIALGRAILEQPLELIDGAQTVLEELGGKHRLLLVTKGDLLDQEAKIASSGLADLFAGIEIVSQKDQPSYRRLLNQQSVPAEHFVMVGNSLPSDILPVVALGGRGIHVPYRVTSHLEIAPTAGPGVITAQSIREVPDILRAMR